jgi:hypothetical protein
MAVQSEHKGLHWFERKGPYVQWMLLLLMLPFTRVFVVGVTSLSREGMDPRSLVNGCVGVS